MVNKSDLKIGDLIIFESEYYKSCDVVVRFDDSYTEIITGNRNTEISKRIIDFYSDAIFYVLRQVSNNVFVYEQKCD